MNNPTSLLTTKLYPQSPSLTPDFLHGNILGEGTYAHVMLVHRKGTPYALKVLDKRKLARSNLQYMAMVER